MRDPINGVAEPVSAMAVKATPPVAVVGAHVVGITVPEAIQIATLVYVILMIIHKCWHMWKEWRTGKVMPETEGELP